MNVLKKYSRKILPKNFREHFVRKVTLQDITPFDTYLSLTLTLKNFSKIKNINIVLSNDVKIQELSHRLHQQTLTINVPYTNIKWISGKSSINVIINDEKMIVRPAEKLSFEQKHFYTDGGLFSISTNRTITLEHLFPGYTFASEVIEVENVHASYNNLSLSFHPDKGSEKFNIALLYPQKVVVLNNEFKTHYHFSTSNFENISRGKVQLYAIKNSKLYPLKFKKDIQFNTSHYNIYLTREENRTSATLRLHEVLLKKFDNLVDGEDVRISLRHSMDIDFHSIVVIDTLTQETSYYPITHNKYGENIVRLPLGTLIDTSSRKRFELCTEGAHPLYIQPSIEDPKASEFNTRIRVLYKHEIVKIWFYQRKDFLIGFNLTRPKLNKVITNISNSTVEGYINGLDGFVGCKVYLAFEDRYSFENIRFEISNTFKVDLKKIGLVNIKSKGKTIIDFFIEIVSEEGDLIRKGKVKYQHADYKKDNYYASYKIVDKESNIHYQLITTTPYDNIKIESFVIPNSMAGTETDTTKDMNTWLLGERYDTAQDNGYAMFKWLKEKTSVNAYYVIEDDSKDYYKVKDEENVLLFGSIKHFQISFKAGVLLGTHDLENLLPFKPAKGFYDYEKTIKVFLQHGVLGRKPAEYDKKYYETPFDLFIVSSSPEKEQIVIDKMGYKEDEVAVTGLARFDNLPFNNTTKDILLMPTWRDWIGTDKGFLNSKYYHRYMSLVHNPRLIKLLEENNITLNFYPHYRAQKYFNAEYLDTSERIHFITLGEQTVQDLLIKHSLLITDYSSVSFDFTLMNKPVIYYHFDVRRFFKNGKLRPIKETFIGDIAKDENDLIDLIEEHIHNNFINKHTNISGIFEYQDHNNRERIYNAVLNKINAAD